MRVFEKLARGLPPFFVWKNGWLYPFRTKFWDSQETVGSPEFRLFRCEL